MGSWRSGRIRILTLGSLQPQKRPSLLSLSQCHIKPPHSLISNKKRTMLPSLFLIVSTLSWIHLLIASSVTFWLCRPCFMEQPPVGHCSSALPSQSLYNRWEYHGGLAATLQLLFLTYVVLGEEGTALLEVRWQLLPLCFLASSILWAQANHLNGPLMQLRVLMSTKASPFLCCRVNGISPKKAKHLVVCPS